MSFQGRFFKSVRTLLRLFCPRCATPPLESFFQPAVYVCHHQNMRGPIATMLWMPIAVHSWSLNTFFDAKVCKRHFQEYTFSKRYGWPKWFSSFAGWAIGRPVTALLRSMGAIPVYRKSVQSIKTVRQSVDALAKKESLIIYPDIDYSSDEAEIGEIYDGFLLVERSYYKRTGKHIPFVPLYVSAKEKTMILGEPIYFEDGDFSEQHPIIRKRIRDAINHLAANH
ncbi:MAG TPA: glycerol acyltransferase [Clostridia bacterium]|nr:glycerol acyltransferase [Clostridia bacterium]